MMEARFNEAATIRLISEAFITKGGGSFWGSALI